MKKSLDRVSLGQSESPNRRMFNVGLGSNFRPNYLVKTSKV